MKMNRFRTLSLYNDVRSGFIKKGTSKWTGLGSWAFSDGCIEEFVRSFDRRSLDTFTFFYSSFQFIFKFDSLSSHLLSFLSFPSQSSCTTIAAWFPLAISIQTPASCSIFELKNYSAISGHPIIGTLDTNFPALSSRLPATLAEECTSWFVRKNGVTVIENGLPLTSKPSAKC